MGGMRRSKARNCLVIICDHTKMYDDKWKDGVLHYTGMGKNGDQVLSGNQNGTLYYSDTNGVTMYLFEVLDAGEYTYRGQVKLAGKPYKEQQRGEDGRPRQVWMFPIAPVNAPYKGSGADNPFKKPKTPPVPKTDEELAEEMSLKDLKKIATRRSTFVVEQKEVTTKEYFRDPYVSELAKRLAAGKCELCCQPAPFKDSKGRPYLETHHVVWLSKGGSDSIDNTVALCPNCHRKMHIVNDEADIRVLLRIAINNALG